MAAEVARALDRPLRAVVARKVGAPGHEELAVGAVGSDGVAVLDEQLLRRLGASTRWIDRAVARARRRGASDAGAPVGPPDTLARLRADYDDVFELAEPEGFVAVGQFYRSFIQATDDEVRRLLGT